MKLKKGDKVKMLSGKDRGKTGKIVKIDIEKRKVAVEGLNIIKKHVRPRKQGEKGQRIEIPRLIDISNVTFVCPKCSSGTRIGYKLADNEGQKQRVCKKCKQAI
ncbi:MAG: 50S ribosomal protein L24 [Patescibacteria group bacterium]|nr:50S ribosomal protein L24 [Patescibacteria group bacterium]